MKHKKLLAVAAVGVIAFVWYRGALGAVRAGEDARVPVHIDEGTSMDGIAALLHEKELIRSPLAFKIYAQLNGHRGKLQAGDFILRRSMNVETVIQVLRRGYSEEISLTIPEGYTVRDIDRLIAGKGLAETGAIIGCAKTCDFSSFSFLPPSAGLAERGGRVEGYLYPDTYFVTTGDFEPKDFLTRMLTTFRSRVIDELGADIGASGRTTHEIVTMASLIEEETRTADERPAVSGILWKRFDGEIGLGVDAAVRYIIDKPRGAITVSDLDIDSAYNLRKYRGLPPGPIANPGIASIKAALRPKDSPYWYYLHDSQGRIHYAVTNDEHNRNRALYLQ